jgi:hypothetical protein
MCSSERISNPRINNHNIQDRATIVVEFNFTKNRLYIATTSTMESYGKLRAMSGRTTTSRYTTMNRLLIVVIGVLFVVQLFYASIANRRYGNALTISTVVHTISSLDVEPIFPETKFTRHVQEVVGQIENRTLRRRYPDKDPLPYWPEMICKLGYRIFVDIPFSAPTRIECRADNSWCAFFKHLFSSNTTILPYNVSLGESMMDRNTGNGLPWGNCISSSAPRGLFTMTNFQDIKNHVMYGRGNHTGTGFAHNNSLPWEERQTKPVFRGHPRMLDRTEWKVHPEKCPSHVKEMGHRPKAADFSMDHPDLLDAAVSSFNTPCLKNNATEGLDRIFGSKIPQDQYFGKYQTVVVLGGIGA